MAQSGREASKYAVFTKYAHTGVQQHIKNARLTCALHAGCTEGGGGAGEVLGGVRDGLGRRRGLRGLRGGAGVQALRAKLKLRLQPSRDRPAAPSALESGSTAGTAGLASAPAMAEADRWCASTAAVPAEALQWPTAGSWRLQIPSAASPSIG